MFIDCMRTNVTLCLIYVMFLNVQTGFSYRSTVNGAVGAACI